ncbi:type IV pilin [Halarchaeum sp. P4]|uniref:type IV pilin n=1 Tax=Halarchaeum sp. P4 TaxID=3421639 RepID=UPI003EB7AA98
MDVLGVFSDERAVSPVVGTILMVAITVILAAVIGAAVFGIVGDIGQTAPQATFEWDYNNSTSDTLTVMHAGGESIKREQLAFNTTGATVQVPGENGEYGDSNDQYLRARPKQVIGDNGTMQAGDSATANYSDFESYTSLYGWSTLHDGRLHLNGSTATLVWNGGERSAVLSGWEGPDENE